MSASRSAPASASAETAPDTTPIADQITVTSRRIACDGGGGALGHPRVWLNLGEEGRITCPYCSRLFVLADEIDTAAGR